MIIEFYRLSPAVLELAGVLEFDGVKGLSDKTIDELFRVCANDRGLSMKYTHISVSCAVVLAAFSVGLNHWLAWLVTAVFWASHEWTQAEYRWIESLGTGKRGNMPWWGGFDPRVWNVKPFGWI